MLRRTSRVLCCCSGGKVRSVAAKYVLEDDYGFVRVVAGGLEKLDTDTVAFLAGWADAILVVGEPRLFTLVPGPLRYKATHLNVGADTYGQYNDARLLARLRPLIAPLVAPPD